MGRSSGVVETGAEYTPVARGFGNAAITNGAGDLETEGAATDKYASSVNHQNLLTCHCKPVKRLACAKAPLNIPEAPLSAREEGIVMSKYRLSPLAQILRAGAEREKLVFAGDAIANAQWTRSGDAGGDLHKDGQDWFYKPPKEPTPAAIYNNNGETYIPAAFRTSLAVSPAQADRIMASNGSDTATTELVTTLVPPTHFIRFTLQSGGLALSCHYFNRDQEEKKLADEDVKWHRLAGNGSVSEKGVFTPDATAPSATTIVMAEDLRDLTEWRYAVTIVPLPYLPASEVVRLQQE
ncbi:hypothetical protein ACIP1G_26715 [Pseudomonas sp. NPDC089392]|uniref:hypothetical protein n=1 Tax=Pseudomonas sp. NPDC089392 TaxID=3364459 RepID=UPI0037FC8D17